MDIMYPSHTSLLPRLWYVFWLPQTDRLPLPGGYRGGQDSQVLQGLLQPVPGHLWRPPHGGLQGPVEQLPPQNLYLLQCGLDSQDMGPHVQVSVSRWYGSYITLFYHYAPDSLDNLIGQDLITWGCINGQYRPCIIKSRPVVYLF